MQYVATYMSAPRDVILKNLTTGRVGLAALRED
jgi:hypothetical protein